MYRRTMIFRDYIKQHIHVLNESLILHMEQLLANLEANLFFVQFLTNSNAHV